MAKGTAGNKVRTIVCAGCGETVTGRMRPDRAYCSLPCYRSAPKPGRQTGETLACVICASPFYVPRGRVGEALCCSLECANEHQGRNKTSHTCQTCGTVFRRSPSRSTNQPTLYCSLPCRTASPVWRAQALESNALLQQGKETRPETIGYGLLDVLGVRYERQTVFAGKFTPDAAVPAVRLLVQFDGDYWHDRAGTSTEPRIRRRVSLDRSQDAYAAACGWRVVRLWESELLADPEGCLLRLAQAVGG